MARTTILAALLLCPFFTPFATSRAQTFSVFPVDRFYETVSYRFGGFSSDESRILASSDKSGIFNLFAINVASGEETQLTSSPADAIHALGYFPKDDRILYTADQGGNELDHVYVRELDGSIVDLTPAEKLKAVFFGWHDDERSFFVATNERDPKFFDLYRYDDLKGDPKAKEPYPRKLVFQNDGGFNLAAVSQNGRMLALERVESNANSDLFVVELENAKKGPKCLTEHKGEIVHKVLTFGSDSRTLWYTSDRDSEWQRAYVWDIQSDKHRQMIDGKSDVTAVKFARNGRYRTVSTNEDARTRVVVTDLKTSLPLELPEDLAADVVSVGFSPSSALLCLSISSDVTPVDFHVYSPGMKKTTKISRSLPAEMDPNGLVSSMAMSYLSFDGLAIPALLYRPLQAAPDQKAPVILWLHGGPGGQCRVGWNPDLQALVNRGYAVFAINNRGSSGYGKTFFHKDDRKHGEDDVKDIVAAKKYLADFNWLDKGKVAVLGGSYGGYLVTAALAFHPDVFDAGIDLFGVTNWVRTLKSMPPWWEARRKSLYKEMGDPATDEKRLTKISTLFSADKIKRPLLVVQGRNDPRVLKIESDELVAAAKKAGATVDYVVFDDEGHGFEKKANRITNLVTMYKFLEKHLRQR